MAPRGPTAGIGEPISARSTSPYATTPETNSLSGSPAVALVHVLPPSTERRSPADCGKEPPDATLKLNTSGSDGEDRYQVRPAIIVRPDDSRWDVGACSAQCTHVEHAVILGEADVVVLSEADLLQGLAGVGRARDTLPIRHGQEGSRSSYHEAHDQRAFMAGQLPRSPIVAGPVQAAARTRPDRSVRSPDECRHGARQRARQRLPVVEKARTRGAGFRVNARATRPAIANAAASAFVL